MPFDAEQIYPLAQVFVALQASVTDLNGYAEIQDLTDVTSYEISVKKIQALARDYKELTESDRESGRFVATKLAYVAPDSIAFGTARVYDALTSSTGINFGVFRSIEPAIEWLDLSAEAHNEIKAIRLTQDEGKGSE
jgi:hypothetical protein